MYIDLDLGVLTGLCIRSSQVCDVKVDCSGGEDEQQNCPVSPTCNATSEFTCGDGSCIPDYWECDNWDDCGDDSDELNCQDGELPAAKNVQHFLHFVF